VRPGEFIKPRLVMFNIAEIGSCLILRQCDLKTASARAFPSLEPVFFVC
jgi:hypothetical protein